MASDLNWRRLKYWRRLLLQALEPASAPGAAETVSEVLVEHGPAAQIFENPREPYTRALISAAFDLELADESAVRS